MPGAEARWLHEDWQTIARFGLRRPGTLSELALGSRDSGNPHDSAGMLVSAFMPDTKITVNNDGSIRIEGDFQILDPTGQPFGLGGRTVIGLCRCGQSQNKPFCDGSHAKTGFQDKVVARELPPPKPKI